MYFILMNTNSKIDMLFVSNKNTSGHEHKKKNDAAVKSFITKDLLLNYNSQRIL